MWALFGGCGGHAVHLPVRNKLIFSLNTHFFILITAFDGKSQAVTFISIIDGLSR